MKTRTRQELAAEHLARRRAEHAQRKKAGEQAFKQMTGDPMLVTGRMGMPGETPGIQPLGSAGHVLGQDETRQLTHHKLFGDW